MLGSIKESQTYYEQKLRSAFNQACENRENLIKDQESWNCFVALMLRTKLISIKDSERLEEVRPSFPLTFETFIQTISQAFGDQSLKMLNLQFDETVEQLENCRTFINMMNVSMLHRDELKQLASLVYRSSKQSKQAQEAMESIFK